MPLSDRLLAFKALCNGASPAPWEADKRGKASDETYYAVQGPDGKVLFDSANSEDMEIHTEHDEGGEGGVTHWDEIGRRNLQFAAACRTEVPFLFEQLAELEKFKAYVHQRLDTFSVPTDPKPEQTEKTGCRIGSRLDWLFYEFNRKNGENDDLRTRLLSAAGDDLCRLTQEEIKAMTAGEVQIPPKGEFLASCERFHAQVAGTAGVLTNCLTLAQLIAENQKLESFKVAYREWLEKTDWVQEQQDSFPLRTLGLHRADVMRKEIERLRSELVRNWNVADTVERGTRLLFGQIGSVAYIIDPDCFPG